MKQKLLAIIDNEFMSKTEKLDALRVHIEKMPLEVSLDLKPLDLKPSGLYRSPSETMFIKQDKESK